MAARKIIKIIATGPVQYSLDGGFSLREFHPGGIHEVPDYAANNMAARGWAKVITEAELETQDAAETTIDVKDLRGERTKP
jgi:hypothetical protein